MAGPGAWRGAPQLPTGVPFRPQPLEAGGRQSPLSRGCSGPDAQLEAGRVGCRLPGEAEEV